MTTANNIEQGRTIRKRFSPTPVYTPRKKACHEIKNAETPLVKAMEKEDSTHASSLIRKRKLVRQITKFVENNKQMERVEEEEWFEC